MAEGMVQEVLMKGGKISNQVDVKMAPGFYDEVT
jgi:hypothetical protein